MSRKTSVPVMRRATSIFERKDILGRPPRLRFAALLRYASCLSGPQLEDLVDDVADLKLTWIRLQGAVQPKRVAVQTQLRAALAALTESDPPDPDCPVGARVKVEFEDKTELGYIVECRDDKYYIVFDDGGIDWYGLEDDGLTVLGL